MKYSIGINLKDTTARNMDNSRSRRLQCSLQVIFALLSLLVIAIPFGAAAGGKGKLASDQHAMTNLRLNQLILNVADKVKGQLGMWQLQFRTREIFILTDEAHNRMRIMTPVIEEEKLQANQLRTILEANFDRALDARYALDRGFVWSVYIHPLAELRDGQFLDALEQVKALADNFGSSYASTGMIFGR